MTERRLAIVGGGPAGLSAARLIRERRLGQATVFEASERVGGKSQTAQLAGGVFEIGTCYSTLEHTHTNRWMRELGIRQSSLGAQHMDGRAFMEAVKQGSSLALGAEALRFARAWRAFTELQDTAPDSPEARRQGAQVIDDWLTKNEFPRMRVFMLRALTTMGYGRLDQVTSAQALRWCTPRLVLSGALNQVKIPLDGWQTFWDRLAQPLDVRLSTPVQAIERRADGVVIETPLAREVFDEVLITIPLDEAATLTNLTPQEHEIADAITWGAYAVTLVQVQNWFRGHETETYSEALEVNAPAGALLAARRGRLPSLPKAGDLYVTGQFGEGLSRRALADQLASDIAERGGVLTGVLTQKVWRYFPRYDPAAVADGLVARMIALQGRNRTWWSGATFSHEAVSNIVRFNDALTRIMAQGDARRPADAETGAAKRIERTLLVGASERATS